MELQRRSQTFNLGILAIEQLTGVVKGDQGSAGSVAGAATGSPDTSGLQKDVDAARKDQANATSDLAEAEKKRNDKADEVNKQSAVQQAAATKLAAATNDADKKAAQDDLTQQSAALDTLQGELTKLEDALTTATSVNTEARRRLSQAIAALQAAQLNARTSGSASGNNELNRGVLAAATPAVAQAVSQIVLSVLLEAGRGEECNGIIADFPKHPDVYQSGPGLSLLNACVADRKLTRDALQRNLLGR